MSLLPKEKREIMATIIIGGLLTGFAIWFTIYTEFRILPIICEVVTYGLTMLLVCGLGASIGVGMIAAAVVGLGVGLELQTKIDNHRK